MNTRDRVITALTPGSPFNTNGLIWRSVQALSQFAGCSYEETLELLVGDLGDIAVVRPSQTGKGLLSALKAHVPQAANPGQAEVVAAVGGPAFNAPAEVAPEPMEEAVEMPEPPAHPEPLPHPDALHLDQVAGGDAENQCNDPECAVCN